MNAVLIEKRLVKEILSKHFLEEKHIKNETYSLFDRPLAELFGEITMCNENRAKWERTIDKYKHPVSICSNCKWSAFDDHGDILETPYCSACGKEMEFSKEFMEETGGTLWEA